MEDVEYVALDIAGEPSLWLPEAGDYFGEPESVTRLLEASMSERVSLVCVPVARLDPAFFQLRSGMAGAMLQRLMNYRVTLAVVGDVSMHTTASRAFADFVRECNRTGATRFVRDRAELEQALLSNCPPPS